ncbi:hypothetical protein EV401DRAFT_1894070 [Pisolithus croceorrhizus]|nr:hypothetical protein EV401DRAFT_1894070 [Pisolithus croceorrhizus]
MSNSKGDIFITTTWEVPAPCAVPNLPDHSLAAPMHHAQGFHVVAGLGLMSCGEGQCSLELASGSRPLPVLFIYDYALTFSKEIDLFWFQPRRTWAFVFFIANRYIGLFGRIPEFVVLFSPMAGGQFYWWWEPVGPGWHLSLTCVLLNSVVILVLQVIGGTRVYAFYNRDRRILSLLVAVAVICIGICGWALLFPSVGAVTPGPIATAQGIDDITYIGCPVVMTPVGCKFVRVLMHTYLMRAFGLDWAVAWGGQLAFDALVFILTLRKLISARSLGKWSYMALSLRDGALYFAMMTAANVANILTYLMMKNWLLSQSPAFRKPYERSMLSLPTNITSFARAFPLRRLCAVMVSRLMLNLRDLDCEFHDSLATQISFGPS